MTEGLYPRTIPDGLTRSAERGAGELVFHLADGVRRMTFGDLAVDAARAAGVLRANGVRPGDAVGLLGPNRPEWATWAFATWWAGAVLVPFGFPLRIRDRVALAEQVASLAATARCRLVVADPALVDVVPSGLGIAWNEPLGDGAGASTVTPDDIAVIQFTSGSTAAPKGVLQTHGTVLAYIRGSLTARRYDLANERLLGWVPFFHDLGLFRYLVTPAVMDMPCDVLPTERFARDPVEWLRLVSSCGTTLTSGPTSAWGTAVRAAAATSERFDLSGVRMAVMGSEGVAPDVVDKVIAAADELSLRRESLIVGYGLAETVIGVTTTQPGEGIRFDTVDLEELVASGRAVPTTTEPAKRIACCGRPYPEADVRIKGHDGPLPERHIGEIQVRSPAVMKGYIGDAAPDPFDEGWLRTGDLGYLADGELYVTGRIKDMIIVLGRNYYPEDFEWAAQRVPGVRPGRVVAVSEPDVEKVVVVVEPASDADPVALATLVANAVADAVGVRPSEVVVVAPNSVLKTSSGKLRRSAMRDAYAHSQLQRLT